MTQGAAVHDAASSIYNMYDIPAVISHNHDATKTDCSNYFIIVSNETQALRLVRKLLLGRRNKIILYSLDEECPGTETRLFVEARVILACGLTDSRYHLSISGEFFALPRRTKISQHKKSFLPNYMGRLLRVSTFDCPPYSYVSKGKYNSKI
jgi:hypothetical protein